MHTADTLCLPEIQGYDQTPQGDDCYEYHEALGQEAVDFFSEHLKHVKGPLAGQPFQLLPWQESLVKALWGWRDFEGSFRYREALVLIPKKQGKSSMAAGLILLHLIKGDFGGEVYSAASSLQQCSNVWDVVHGMYLQSPFLQEQLKMYGGFGGNHQRSLFFPDTLSRYRPAAAKPDTLDGSNVSCCVIDELHRFSNRGHYEFCQVVEMGTAARKNAQVIYTTTTDHERESVCNTKLKYGQSVRDKIIVDDRFLPCIYETSSDADWESEEVWKAANPSLGHTVSLDFLRREYNKAKEMPSHLNSFLRLHLNCKTLVDAAWGIAAGWKDLEEKIDEEHLIGQKCFAGLDLSQREDLTAFVLLFPLPSGNLFAKPYFWSPRVKAEKREQESGAPYLAWNMHGYLDLSPGPVVDYDSVQHRIEKLGELYDIQEVATDPMWAQQLMTRLDESGFRVKRFTQRHYQYTGPVRELEALVQLKKISHDGNPVLNWNIMNTSLDENSSGHVMPSKSRSPDKIDGVTALLMALNSWMMASEKTEEIVYSSRGLFDVDEMD